ncbi:MAG TPA: adenylyl-sulfate kinase [Kofleriaceae bacterium]|nr:adenylyl-sulfate kinase [Kofleriaceae bacterium]
MSAASAERPANAGKPANEGKPASADKLTIVWFTGLPSSGKSTIARRVQERLVAGGRAVVMLDSDEVREVLGARGYAAADRDGFYRALADLAVLVAKQGVIVLVAATAPRREHRDRARRALGESGEDGASREGEGSRAGAGSRARGGFVEVWVSTPLEVCESRDTKGLYARARRGEAPEVPGIGVAYEAPRSPEVVADGDLETAVAAIEALLVSPSDLLVGPRS